MRGDRPPVPPRRRPEDQAGGAESVRETPGRGGDLLAPNWREFLHEKLRLLPHQSGVYLFRDSRGRVIYVGKAKQLHQRVRSYFRASEPVEGRAAGLRRRIRALDWVVTSGEIEALILEDSLIKQYAPHYNIRLKDDKRYPYVKVTTQRPFPGMFLTRQIAADGSRYFGPFTRVKDLRRTLRDLRSVFRLRNCTDARLAQGGRECLQYFIGRCTAPCTLRVNQEEYAEQVKPLLDYLSGRGQEAICRLRERMLAASDALRFEESARLRDGIEVLQELMREQGMTPPVETEAEVIGLAARGNLACGVFLHVREGKVLGKTHRLLTGVDGASLDEAWRALLLAAYLGAPRIPGHLIVSTRPRDLDSVRGALTARADRPVTIQVAPRGSLGHLVALADQNAHLILEEDELRSAQKAGRVDHSVYALQEALALPNPPYRIEGFDISNTQAAHPVASMVVFRDGKAWKSEYRRFRISNTSGPDDFAMMGEVLRRRLVRLMTEGGPPPDLILVDGGRGQVGRAQDVLEETGFSGLALIGLAKREEEIIRPDTEAALRLPRSSEALRLLQRIRDEAHRFAIRYHRGVRTKGQRASRLDSVPGIGPARRRALLRHFGSVEAIRRAGIEDVAAVPGMGPALARTLLEALSETGNDREGGNAPDER
jgi:excinuclease ABC subunit C